MLRFYPFEADKNGVLAHNLDQFSVDQHARSFDEYTA